MSTKIVILGAGYAGVHAAKKLAKKYKKNNEVEITLIDKNPYHTLMTELHEVAGGRVPEESVKVDLYRIFNRTKVNVVVDYIENVDSNNNVVKTNQGEYSYDYLIIGVGSEPAFFGVEGVKENGFTLWSLEDALKIKAHIKDRVKEASYERDAEKRKKMLTFVVAGSGFTGIEMAGELLEWKTTLAREYRVDESEIRLLVVEAMSTILNMLDRKQANKAEKYMVKHGVEILKDSPIVQVTEESIKLKDGTVIPTETLIWTCGVQANQDLSDMDVEKARAGRYSANKYMQSQGRENIYVVGDVAYIEEEPGKENPQIVEAAEQTAVTAAKNIIASIENKEKVEFKSNYHGFMVSIGGRYAVADLMGIKLSGFFAMVMKHLINMVYLFGVNNVHAVYNYLQHEFFAMKERRCIMRGHLSSKGNRLWLVPLRVYIGALWLMEGLKKLIGEGTWDTMFAKAGEASSIGGYINELVNNVAIGADSWVRAGNVNMPFEWLHDAVSGASQAVDGATNMPQPILETVPKLYEEIMRIFMPTPEVAVLFQTMVVIAEIGMGLCLIAGLFTFLASAASAFMTVNFILSAMAGWEILWYTFGSIALMCGAGRTFGLDYYVMPWISNLVGNFWMGKRRPIYEVHGKSDSLAK
ncbi:FAD-dependent oxidoreductase [Clostridium sp. CCUG 7971]|uniref:FAD-dependent oxidoreductase n=1 Tax=Clostridium sp. CCUG 7971 TaxID=2811414 RepID=UPI001ABA895D|nr:FAD-dependent oxidoreductase [Clostridium sp. CCUG 7971]MBO3445493.1 FAD-dependent oxidoreductase [Clostridium sp. CCUG 7971]